jgi:hypothetical protein
MGYWIWLGNLKYNGKYDRNTVEIQ